MEPSNNKLRVPDTFLASGGEMGELIRSKDWSRTPLGPIGTWSQSLRMMTSFLLANRFPLLLWWGPDYIQLYNDPYRPVLGTKHPRSLGQPASACWAEIWNVIGPLIDTPFNGGPATWMEDIFLEINRHGFVEESHFTIAYSPVPDETAPRGIGGVLATVHEITEKVIGERRILILRDLGAHAAEAKTAEGACAVAAETLARYPQDLPFALLYLLAPDGEQAHLAGAAGVSVGGPSSPHTITLGGENGVSASWPLAEAMQTETLQVVEDLAGRFPVVPPGPWTDPPYTAVVVPIPSTKAHRVAGWLVAGVSSRLRLDEAYRSFFELATSQIATAIANARAYEEERARAEALAELDRAKTLFFSNVSHEFRTPLTLMLGPLEEALADDPARLPQHRGELDVAHRNSLRLLKLVNTLLDFSRIEAGRAQACYEPTDLARFSAELASNFRSACERVGLALVVDCPPLPEPVYVDRDMWEKILLNLLSNAFKFTFEGEIAVCLAAVDGAAELTVRDTGVGIPEAELPRLFKRFHRIEGQRSRTYEGSGIGLSLVQELVRLHGGTLRAESTAGQGTGFTVRIPLGAAHLPAERIGAERSLASTAVRAQAYVEEALRWLPDSAGRAEVAADTPVPDEMAPGCGARVLLADDNADMRAYVHRLLGAQYVVEAVADGQAALAAIRARRPDLVLADVMMPQLDGFGLLHAIRTDPALRDLPVVMLSARAGEEARVEGLETGADDYLVKPFVARELLARVDSNLTLSRLRREAVNRVRESEAQLALAIDIAGLGHWEFDPSTGALTASAQCKANFGRAADEPFSYDDLRAAIHPDDRDHQAAAVAQALESKAEFEVEYRLLTSAGELRWIDVCGRFEEGEAGGRLVGVTLDITERKRAEALQAAQTRALELIVEDAPLVQALDRLVRTIEAQSQGMLGSILLLDCDGLHLRHGAAPSLPEQYSQAIDGLDIGPEVGSCGTAAYLQKPVYVCDIATDPRWIQYRDLALPHGLRACWSTPIFSGGGELLGTFAMYYREAREPTAADLALVDVVTRAAALIIERKRTEAALRESEAHYRQLVEFLPVAVYTCKVPSGSITFCNDRAVELWGRAPEIGGAERFCGSFKCYRPDGAFLPRDQTPMALAVQKGQIFRDQEVIAERPDGTRIIALVNIDLIRDERGQVVGALNVFADITERRQNENLLMEQKRLLEMIALGAPLNDCLASLCAAVPRLNPRARASILIADEERQRFSRSITPNLASFGRGLKGAPINDLAIGTCGETVFHVRPITCQDIANDDRWSREWRDLCVANGILACHSAPIVGVDGLPLGSFMLCFDEPQKPSEWERRLAEFGSHIASVALERDRASRALRESERHLRALSGSLEQQVEMRTAELQRQAGRLRRLAAELTSTEQRERKRLAAILHDGLQQLLVAARMRLGLARGQVQDPAVRSTIEGAGELLDQAVDSSRDLTRQLRPPVLYEGGLIPALHWLASELPKLHDLQVAIEAQEAEPALSDDAKALLFESVRELLFNVAKHAGVKEAAVRVRSDARWLRITVVDEGAGFDIETAAQAQDPQQPGLGLFSIRERLAVLSGGVAIESSPGQGTRIALTIPLTVANRPVAGPTRPLVAPGALVQAAAAACQTRVLVVDDHAIVREGIANVLSGDERLVVVAEAADGMEAIEAVERHHPDVVLIDVNMPRMNGVDATREIRRRWPGVRIVALSVQDDAATAKTMIRAGAAALISKSEDAAQMIQAVLAPGYGASKL